MKTTKNDIEDSIGSTVLFSPDEPTVQCTADDCTLYSPYYQDDYVTIYHGDCGKIMPHLGRFDLLLCDPPYGIGADKAMHKASGNIVGSGHRRVAKRTYELTDWDKEPVPRWVMELARNICEKQIIFGGNYYDLPPCKGPLVWDKEMNGNFADGEMAWNNLNGAMRIKKHLWNGMARKGSEKRDHPTQKPLDVMVWALQQAGDVKTALDPWMGSGTTLRACKDAGVKCVGVEMQEKYCEIAAQRMLQEVLDFSEPKAEHHAPPQPELF
jgi:hypothetical protein